MKIKLLLLASAAVSGTFSLQAQMNIGSASAPVASAMLQVTSSNKGFLTSQIALTSLSDVTTVASPATGLIVYNTATAGISPNDVTPGYFYYNGSQWVRIVTSASSTAVGNIYSNDGTLTASRTVTLGANNLTFNATSGNLIFNASGTGKVGLGTTTPAGALDVNSTSGGIVVPRMTTAQRTALTAVNGTIVYNTTTAVFEYYQNGSWGTPATTTLPVQISNSYSEYTGGSASVPAGFTTVAATVKVSDANNNYNTSTGIYTVPYSGTYLFQTGATLPDNSNNPFGGGVGTSNIDDANFKWDPVGSTSASIHYKFSNTIIRSCTAGDHITMYFFAQAATVNCTAASFKAIMLSN